MSTLKLFLKKKNIFCGVSAILSFLTVATVGFNAVCMKNAGVINDFFGINTSEMVNMGSNTGDTLYYGSSYGDGTLSAKNLDALVEDTLKHNVQELEEGSVLLKNDADALPLKSTERRMDVYGKYSEHLVGFNATTDNANYISFKNALLNENFDLDGGDKASVACVVLSRTGKEGEDLKLSNANGESALALEEEEKNLLKEIKSKGYEKIIAIINASNAMELEWMYSTEYGVDAALWVGGPGVVGSVGIVNVLTGKACPSGRLVDTYASNSLSSPACVNGNNNSQKWSNVSYLQTQTTERMSSVSFYNIQAENIYVGYKYYETRYEDSLLSRFGANDSVGSSTGGAWNYADEITYPFGYGLSYTQFEQSIKNVEKSGGEYAIDVEVKNVGDVAGKSVIQVYGQTPYGDYEINNKIEKSSIQLVGYGKTETLQPDESEIVTVTVEEYLLASYDYVNGEGGYALTAGDYYLAIGENSHDALNNVLAAKNVNGLYDENGAPVDGDASKAYTWKQAENDYDSYKLSYSGKVEVKNQFEDCDINYWIKDAVTYLTRSDWKNTYPIQAPSLAITDEMIQVINGEEYTMPDGAEEVYKTVVQGKDAGITSFMMMGKSFDDPTWDVFISQMSIEEMAQTLSETRLNDQIDSIVMPSYRAENGPLGLSSFYNCEGSKYDGTPCCRYADKPVLAATWNEELIENRGRLNGEEMLFAGYYEIYAPGANLHRTPFSGRNNEYYSEDANLTYMILTTEVVAMQKCGVTVQVKHIAGNDQEYNRQGICTFFTEQAFREGALRGFEGAMTKGESRGCMGGLHRLGLRWTNSSKAFCTGVLRNEWGFLGRLGTDGLGGKYMLHFSTSLSAGTTSYDLDNSGSAGKYVIDYLRSSNDGYMLLKLREAVKYNLYYMVNSPIMNGLTENTVLVYRTAWWQTALTSAICVLGAAYLAVTVCYVIGEIEERRSKNENK